MNDSVKTVRLHAPGIVMLCTVLAGTAALAQEASQMGEIAITGSRAPQSMAELPGTALIIEGEELQAQIRGGVPLKEALGILVPGLDIGPQGRTNYGQNLRGRSVLVMVDGVSLNSSRGLSRQFDSIDPFNIDRIEVLSGASSLYGGGATGGIINIITRRGEAGLHFETEAGVRSGLRHGDDHDLRVAQSISGGNDVMVARLGIAAQKNGAAYDGNNTPVRTDITQTDLQYNRSLDLYGSLDFKLGHGQKLGLQAQVYQSKYDGDTALYLGPNLAGTSTNASLLQQRDGFSSDVVPQTQRASISADYSVGDILGGQNLVVQLFARRERVDFYPFPSSATGTAVVPVTPTTPAGTTVTGLRTFSSSRQNTDAMGLKAALTKRWDTMSLTYGVDADRETFDANQVRFDLATSYASGGLVNNAIGTTGRYPGYRVDGLSAFAQGEWKASSALSLSAGVRQQRMDVRVDDFVQAQQQVLVASGIGASADAIPGGSNRYNVTLLNAGAVYKISPLHRTWLNYSEGFELADPAKYYGVGSYLLQGGATGRWVLQRAVSVNDSPLAGIKTRQVETGWSRRVGGLSLQVAAFYSWSDKNLTYVPVTLSVNVLEQNKRNYGIEGSVAYALARQWTVGGNFLAIRSERQDSNGWGKQDVTEASPSKLVSYVGWNRQAASVRLQGVKTFDVSDELGNTLHGATTFDLLGSYALPVGRLSFGIQNLFDKTYATLWSQRAQVFYKGLATPETFAFNGRGRTFGLSYSVNY